VGEVEASFVWIVRCIVFVLLPHRGDEFVSVYKILTTGAENKDQLGFISLGPFCHSIVVTWMPVELHVGISCVVLAVRYAWSVAVDRS
jgi:hypothetical protein